MTGSGPITTTRDPIKIIANIFISFIGAGVLGLPYAFKKVRILQHRCIELLYNDSSFSGRTSGGNCGDGGSQLLCSESHDVVDRLQVQGPECYLSV